MCRGLSAASGNCPQAARTPADIGDHSDRRVVRPEKVQTDYPVRLAVGWTIVVVGVMTVRCVTAGSFLPGLPKFGTANGAGADAGGG